MNHATCSGGASCPAALVAGLLSVIVGWNSPAQIPEEQRLPPAATPVPPEAAPLQEEKLDMFADAYLSIEEIHTRTSGELAKTDDPVHANAIKAKAESQIIQAIERSGLKLDEFNQISELAAVDDALRMKIADRVEKRRRI
jgi:Domain of unknown function (DUF4168)